MIQTVIVILLVLADVALIQMNLGHLGAQITLAVPGMAPVAVTGLAIMAAAGAVLVVAWIAGQVDRAVLERQIRRRDTTLHVIGEELARVMGEEWVRIRATVDDRESRPWAELRTRLDVIDRDLQGLRERVDRVARDGEDARIRQVPVTG